MIIIFLFQKWELKLIVEIHYHISAWLKKKYLVFVNLQQLFFMKIIVFFCSILHRQVQFFTFLAIKLQIELTKKLDDIGRASVHVLQDIDKVLNVLVITQQQMTLPLENSNFFIVLRYQFVKTTQYRPRSSKCLKSYFDRQNIFGIFSRMFTYTYFMHVDNHFRDKIGKVQSKKWILDIGGLTRALGTIFLKLRPNSTASLTHP